MYWRKADDPAMFCYDGLPFLLRLVLFALSLGAAGYFVQRHGSDRGRVLKQIRRIARRPAIAIALLVLLCLSVNLALAAVRYPQPRVHDEFAYLLASDTYASGRLTNPTHPHWEHFETFHVLSHPSYMAKYPPGNGLVLAFGQWLTGHSIVGSWLAMAAALVCLWWMMRAWIPDHWALAGCLLLSINVPILMAWGQTWWGGSLQLAGGALLFGAMKRITDSPGGNRPLWPVALPFAIGAVILACTRPLEGLLACLVSAGVLAIWLCRQPRRQQGLLLLQMALPMLLVGSCGLQFLLVNNQAVTGKALTLPYSAHSRQYSATSMWVWRPLPATPEYNLDRMESLYVNWSRARQASAQTLPGFVELARKKLNLLWRFFPLAGGLCLVPAFFLTGRNRRWLVFCGMTIVAMLCLQLQLINSYAFPHYVAPVACLFYVLLFHGLRGWHLAARHWKYCRLVLPTVTIYCVLSLLALFGWTHFRVTPTARSQVEDRLLAEPGRHLVFVRYSPGHNLHEEWVYNRADIDRSKIVWANCLSLDANRELMEYYPDRIVWQWEADAGRLQRMSRDHQAQSQ
jgi:hypothetical protein